MSRIVNSQNGYRIREKALRLIGNAINEASKTSNIVALLDIASFIALSLDEIEHTVRETANAWEKRDYWVKADQFRSEWQWVGEVRTKLSAAIQERDSQRILTVLEGLRKNKKILEGMLNAKKGRVDYSGSYERFRRKIN